MRAAIVLRQRHHHGAALLAAIDVAPLQALQIHVDAVEIGAHARDLPVEVDALLRLEAAEQEETGALATLTASLRRHRVELGLLAPRGFLVAPHLLGARRIAACAAVDGGKLAFEAGAHLILVGLAGRLRARAGRPRLRLRSLGQDGDRERGAGNNGYATTSQHA